MKEKNMLEHFWNNPIKYSDLKVYQYGYEECAPNHSYGPANRDHFLLHFISSGKGTFRSKNKSYALSAGQGFLICPGIVTSYSADENEPWTYSWIGFSGTNAEYYLSRAGLSSENPVFSYENTEEFHKIFAELLLLDRNKISDQVRMIGYIYMLLALMMENSSTLALEGKAFFSSKEEYVKNAVLYLQTNFSRKVTVQETADYLGLNRSYLGVIFKEITGLTPQEFLVDFRIDKAKKLLLDKSMSIGDVSRSVGYDDPLTFSKLFKKKVGISLNSYRKTL
jgi:AraC-like DNA-binding protein